MPKQRTRVPSTEFQAGYSITPESYDIVQDEPQQTFSPENHPYIPPIHKVRPIEDDSPVPVQWMEPVPDSSTKNIHSMSTIVHVILTIIHIPLTIAHLILLYTSETFVKSKWYRHLLHTIVIGLLCIDFLTHRLTNNFNFMNLISSAIDTIFVIVFGLIYFTQPLKSEANKSKIVGANVAFLIFNILLLIGWLKF